MDILEILINDHPAPEGQILRPISPSTVSPSGLKRTEKWMVDTGASGNFAKRIFLRPDPAQTDHLVLSHNHYDHTGDWAFSENEFPGHPSVRGCQAEHLLFRA